MEDLDLILENWQLLTENQKEMLKRIGVDGNGTEYDNTVSE